MNQLDFQGLAPIHYACMKQDDELFQYVLEHTDLVKVVKSSFITPLMIVARHGPAKYIPPLIENGEQVNCHNSLDQTPLLMACSSNRIRCVREILKFNPIIDPKDLTSPPPLFIAARKGYKRIVDILLSHGANPYRNYITLIHILAERGYRQIIKVAIKHQVEIDRPDFTGVRPLHKACENDRQAIVRLLLRHGADVNSRTNFGHTPLHYACMCASLRIVKILVNHNADVNAQNHDGETPLKRAIERGSRSIVRYLLKKGAKCPDDYLHFAVINKRESLIEDIVAHITDINSLDKRGFTALYYASFYGHTRIFHLLIKLGAKNDFSLLVDGSQNTNILNTPSYVPVYSYYNFSS